MNPAVGGNAETAYSMPGCSSLGMVIADRNLPCPEHDPSGSGLNECCGDQCCSSVQLFITMEINLHISTSFPYFSEFSSSFPDISLSPEHRPPLDIS